MPAMPSGTLACPDAEPRLRLAAQLSTMIPGAATVYACLNDPEREWPHPHATATDAAGGAIALNRTASRTAARWMMRVWPDLDWNRPRILDLATATLTATELAPFRRGR